MGAYRDAYPGRTEQQHLAHFNAGMREAVIVGRWGTDEHLFALALLLDRPIFQYCTNPNHGIPATVTVEQFALMFLSFQVETRGNVPYCTSAHRVLLAGGDVSGLPLPPIAVLMAMLPHDASSMMHKPIPRSRIMAD